MKRENKSLLFLILVVFLALVVFVAPFSVVAGVYFGGEKVYRNTFYAELDDKYDALYSAEGEKIVIIGGSSVAFGYDSETLSEVFGRPVINFGLYAELGTKLMLDLAEDAIREGDIVLIAPELDAQTLSLYFNGRAALRALEQKPSMVKKIGRENLASLFGAIWSFTGEKLDYLKNGAPDPVGVYNSRNFNAAGDVFYFEDFEDGGETLSLDGRAANTMNGYYQSSNPIIPDKKIVSTDFLDYLNAFIDRIADRGAKAYYVFCPMNAMALTEKDENGIETTVGLSALTLKEKSATTAEISGVSLSGDLADRCARFGSFLSRNLHCPVLGSMTDFVYDPKYFYDTNFHLNTQGVKKHTAAVGNLLYAAENDTDEKPFGTYADPKGFRPLTASLLDTGTVYEAGDLLFRLTIEVPETFTVVGVSAAGMEKETIIVPSEVTVTDANLNKEITRGVASLATEAFKGTTKLKTVVIGDDVAMKEIGTRAFADSSVSELYLFCPVEGFLAGKDLLGGARSGFMIRVGRNLGYETDYSWGEINVEGQPKTLVATDKTFSDFMD